MEYAAGGSLADIIEITEEGLIETEIAFVLREALKVCSCLYTHHIDRLGHIILACQ